MLLDRKITLYQPGPLTRDNQGNRTRGAPTTKTVYAKRNARPGNEGIVQETAYQSLPVEYIIRMSPSVADINRDWWLTDAGQEYRIESTHESSIGRRQFTAIRAIAKI